MVSSIYLWCTLMTFFQSGVYALKRSYIVAAYEHVPYIGNFDPHLLVIEENIKKYQRAAKFASSKGADIIVYPEHGLLPPKIRGAIYSYEDIPNPKEQYVNPCEQKELYSSRPMIQNLSCIAKDNNIVVVANAGDVKHCSKISNCSLSGNYYFNTNVVFDKNGTMLLRYHKEHLQVEIPLNSALQEQDPTFETDFGIFATYSGMDIMYGRAAEVAHWPRVDGIMFSSIWAELTPQYSSVPFWQAWAIGNNITIVVSNLRDNSIFSVGSGIFHGKYGAIGYTFNPDKNSKIIIAEIPFTDESAFRSEISVINDTDVHGLQNDGESVNETCSARLISKNIDELRCIEESTAAYTRVKLIDPVGHVEACNNGMCCSANYSAVSMTEGYYLLVFNGTQEVYSTYPLVEENCLIVRCDGMNNPSWGYQECGTFPRRTNTVFHHIEIKANFSTPYIYPAVVSSKGRLVSLNEWQYDVVAKSAYEGSFVFNSDSGRSILNAGFKARCYERDPPYEGIY